MEKEVGFEDEESKAINYDLNNIEFAKQIEDEQSTEDAPNYRYASRLDVVLLVLATSTSVAQGILLSVSSVIFRHLSDALIDGQHQMDQGNFTYSTFHDAAMHAIYMYALYGLGIFILAVFNMTCWHTICERQIHQIRIRYFAAVLRQNMAWFDRNESGVLTTKMSDGIDRIKDGIGDKIGVIFVCTSRFCAGLVIAFSLNWKMTLVMLVFVPLMVGAITGTARLIGAFVRRELREYGKAGAVAEEVIGGIRTVIAFNGQEIEAKRYRERLKSAEKCGIKKAALVASGTACIHLTLFTSMGIAFWYGTKLVIWGEITPGVTFALFWAVMGGALSLAQAAPQIGVLVGSKAAAASIFAIIDRVPEINSESKEGSQIEHPTGRIEFRDVHFRYPTRPDVAVLNGVSYTVEPGQTVALVGHSGCGKSTMVGLLLRFYELEQGEVLIDGVPVSKLNVSWLRNNIGVVSQEPVLFAATIEENLRLGRPEMTEEEMRRVCKMANAHDFITKLPEGYKTRIGEGGVQLSGGQKQRMAIARALARDPQILLLDEATSALDTESELVVQQALEQASSGRTTIAIAHRLSTIRSAHRIIVFDHGSIVESGTHDELIAVDGVYRQLVRAQEIAGVNQPLGIIDEEDDGLFGTGRMVLARSLRELKLLLLSPSRYERQKLC